MLLVLAIIAAVLWLPAGWGIATVAAATVVEVAEVGFWIWLSRRRRIAVGAEALPGARALVVTACRPDGYVRVHGELWKAMCAEGAEPGDEVVVERLDNDLVLLVNRPAEGRN